jgi:hypothetical protein
MRDNSIPTISASVSVRYIVFIVEKSPAQVQRTCRASDAEAKTGGGDQGAKGVASQVAKQSSWSQPLSRENLCCILMIMSAFS